MTDTQLKTGILSPKDDSPHMDGEYSFILHSISDPQLFLTFVLDAALTMTAAHAGSIFLWDEYQKELVLKAARGPYQEKVTSHIKLREGILGWVGDRGHSVLVKNIQEDNRFHEFKSAGSYKSHSFISVPLIAHNKLVGVLNITEKEHFDPFSDEDFNLIQNFSRHTAVAFENLKLFSQIKKENEILHQKVAALEQMNEKNEHLIAIGKFATNLAHELNNPLDAIRRYMNLALDQALEDSMVREYLLKAKKGVRRAIRVIRGLLQFSKDLHQTAPRNVEIHTLIENSVAAVQTDPGFDDIRFDRKLSSVPAFVMDRGLSVVFQNIFQNAQQAMNGKGCISVETHAEDSRIRMYIDDTGHGIHDSVKSHLFDPFFSTKAEGSGTGIGLAISKEIVERSGGTIACENAPSGGARFVIILPCQYQSPGKAA